MSNLRKFRRLSAAGKLDRPSAAGLRNGILALFQKTNPEPASALHALVAMLAELAVDMGTNKEALFDVVGLAFDAEKSAAAIRPGAEPKAGA